MATTFAPATTSTNTNNPAANEIRASINITNRVPLVSAQTTNCEQALNTTTATTTIATRQSYLDHTSFKNEKKQPSYKSSSAEQSTYRLENRLNTDITTPTIYSSAKTTTAMATTESYQPSLSKNNGRNQTLSNTKANQAHNSSQIRSSNFQVDKNQTSLINQASTIKTPSSCSNRLNTPLSSLPLSSSLSSLSSSSSSSSSTPSSSTSTSTSTPSLSSSSSSLAPLSQAHNSQSQNQNHQLQYPEKFYKMRERLFRMLSKVPIQVETEPKMFNQQHYSRKLQDSSPVHLTNSASTSISTPNSASTSVLSVASSTCSSSRSDSSRRIDQEALIIKYYHDKSLNDILDQHFGCALINHNCVLDLALGSHQPPPQQQQQQSSHFLDNSGAIVNLGNVSNFVADQHHQSTYYIATTDNEMYHESLIQQQQQQHQQHPFAIEECLDWPNSNLNSYNLGWQMGAQHGSFELTIPSVQNKAPNTKRLTNQKRPTISTVKDHHKYAPNTNRNQRQPAKRQRLSNSARQHKNIAPSSNMPMNSFRAMSGQAKNVRELHTTSKGRNLPPLAEYQQPFKQEEVEKKEDEDEEGEQEHLQQEQVLLVRPINGKSSKYDESVSCTGPRIDSGQHFVFDNNFLVSRPLVNSQTGISNQETRTNRIHLDSQPMPQTSSYTTSQPNQAQQQFLNHHSNNHLNIHELQGRQNETPNNNLYHNNLPPNYLPHQDQVSIVNYIEPHQSSLNSHHHQLGQHFELREPSSCYGLSPQVVDQQQQFLTDNSSYYQPQTTYLQVEPQSEWQCHSQHNQHALPPPPPHTQQQQHHHHHLQQEQHSSYILDDISQQQQQQQQQQQHMIDQHQPHDGLFSESYSVRRHNFNSQNSPYHLPEPIGAYSLICQSDCNTTQLNLNPTNNNNPDQQQQQLLLIDETSQYLNHSVCQLSGLLN